MTSASTPETAADLIHAPKFLGSIILSKIRINTSLSKDLSRNSLKSLKFKLSSAVIIASGYCFSFF